MRRAVWVFAGLLALLLAGGALWQASNSRTFQLFGDLVPRVATAERVVALTFDDGPTEARVDEVLSLLHQADVRATFFVTGRELAQNPEGGRRLVAAGHELGNHSYSHTRLLLQPPATVEREIVDTDALIRAAGYSGPIAFRPPYGNKLLVLPLYLAQTGRVTVTWDVEPDSYADVASSAERIAAHALERVRPGSIVLLHVWYDARETSCQAIPSVVAGLKERGYRFVTVAELLAQR
ncbi:MAG: polysaccharide deacetylase family protein [Chloroflexota bacterium]